MENKQDDFLSNLILPEESTDTIPVPISINTMLENPKEVKNIALELLLVINGINRNAEFFKDDKDVDLVKLYKGIAEDLDDILYMNNIVPFVCDTLNIKEQEVIGYIETNNKELDKTLAENVFAGYKYNDQIIKKERIKIYKYREEKT